MRHKVTRKHILFGIPGSGSSCPIHLCLRETVGLFYRFTVGPTDVRFHLSPDCEHKANFSAIGPEGVTRRYYRIDLPNEVKQFISSFDFRLNPTFDEVERANLEFEFNLEIPKEFLDLRLEIPKEFQTWYR